MRRFIATLTILPAAALMAVAGCGGDDKKERAGPSSAEPAADLEPAATDPGASLGLPGERPSLPELPAAAAEPEEGERRGRGNREERRARFAERRAKLLAEHDANGDGELDEAERSAMRQARLAGRIERIDSDGDGAVSRAEAEAAPRRHRRMLRDFDTLDANGDGSITTDELAAGMKQRRERRFRHRRGGGEDTDTE
jgi:hypothetical protein